MLSMRVSAATATASTERILWTEIIIATNGRETTMLEFLSGMFIGAVIGAAAIALLRAGKDER